MTIKSRATANLMKSLRVGDELELELYNDHNINKKLKVMIKITDFVKEKEKCAGCGIILKGKAYEFIKKLYCYDCLCRQKENKSKISGHKPPDKFFGQIRNK